MKALVLEKAGQLSLRDIYIEEHFGADDVRIKVNTVGICGSDVHYYRHGAIGPFAVKHPMVLGHEASGTVIEAGKGVKHLKVGDRVCMEPGIPDPNSRATRLGMYNLDPAVRFWATPPVHGCLRETLVHPGMFVFKLPDNVGFDEGALAEPLAVAVHAVRKAQIKPGDVGLVIGAGTIGMVTAMTAKAGGCSKVIVADVVQEKLDLALSLGLIAVNAAREDFNEIVAEATEGWGWTSSLKPAEANPRYQRCSSRCARADESCSSACRRVRCRLTLSQPRSRRPASRPYSGMLMLTPERCSFWRQARSI